MPAPRETLVEQINAAFVHYLNMRNNYEAERKASAGQAGIVVTDPTYWSEAGAFTAAAVAAIENTTGRDSSWSEQARQCVAEFGQAPRGQNPIAFPCIHRLKGILDQVHSSLMSGLLLSYAELIHGEMFGDFLEMAEHLLTQGYKDAAAVVAGTALEVHLRGLCKKHQIPVTVTKGSNTVAKKATGLNDGLLQSKVYNSLEHKQVTAWQDLRNKSAHGDYGSYDAQQVALLVQGIRDFIAKYPA